MTSIELDNTNHDFRKQNLVTLKEGKYFYDLYKCINCGIKAKRFGFKETLLIDGRVSKNKVLNCPKAKLLLKICITHCTAFGEQFKNLVPGSIHSVIESPGGQNNNRGVWVMGVGEPVKVLFKEFKEYIGD